MPNGGRLVTITALPSRVEAMEIPVEKDPEGAARRLQERAEALAAKWADEERRKAERRRRPDEDRLPYRDPE
jgi:hypothetical protein